ncbi:MAG: response regulator [Nitrospirae bacterium]|nr:response regulator [Nitrospirota bacterium]MBI3352394.1 response regulator [Nitrospirota bacterium]
MSRPSFQDVPRILIVDDEEPIREILTSIVNSFGYPYKSVKNGFDAITLLNQEPFDVVLCDVRMPMLDGYQLIKSVLPCQPHLAFVMITASADAKTATKMFQAGATDYITKPFHAQEIRETLFKTIETQRKKNEERIYLRTIEKAIQTQSAMLTDALKVVDISHKGTLEALVNALDAREHETQCHSKRVRDYTLHLAQKAGLDSRLMPLIGDGALLHDIGKIGVSDAILLKPAKLTAEEWVEMKKHPQIGYTMLKEISFLKEGADIVLSHQERFDGTGYPRGLKKEEIPIGARLFSICDTFDCMTSNRPYRKALSMERALEEIKTYSGTQFDPEMASVFLKTPLEDWIKIKEQANLT